MAARMARVCGYLSELKASLNCPVGDEDMWKKVGLSSAVDIAREALGDGKLDRYG